MGHGIGCEIGYEMGHGMEYEPANRNGENMQCSIN